MKSLTHREVPPVLNSTATGLVGVARVCIAVLVLAGLLAPAGVEAQGSASFQVVVHEDNDASSISPRDLSRIFLKRITKWEGGDSIQPVDQSMGSQVRDEFSNFVHGRPSTAIRSYWQTLIYSGRGVPPPEMASDQEVLAFVRSNPGAIGYVRRGVSLGRGVRVLSLAP